MGSAKLWAVDPCLVLVVHNVNNMNKIVDLSSCIYFAELANQKKSSGRNDGIFWNNSGLHRAVSVNDVANVCGATVNHNVNVPEKLSRNILDLAWCGGVWLRVVLCGAL